MFPDSNQLKTQLLFPQLLNGGLEALLNYLLKRTTHSERYLYKLNGKVLKIALQKMDFSLYLLFTERRIDVLNHYDDTPDCLVNISLSLLFNPPTKQQLSDRINDQSIQLQGDLDVLQNFTALMEDLEKDPARLLSPYIGDVLAFSSVNFLQNLTKNLKLRLEQSQLFWGERLTEEWKLVSPSLAITDFSQKVESVAKQTALLEQKFKNFQQSLAERKNQ